MSPFPVNKHSTNKNNQGRFTGLRRVRLPPRHCHTEKIENITKKTICSRIQPIMLCIMCSPVSRKKLELRSTAYQNATKCSIFAAKVFWGGMCPSPDRTSCGNGDTPHTPLLRRLGSLTPTKISIPVNKSYKRLGNTVSS